MSTQRFSLKLFSYKQLFLVLLMVFVLCCFSGCGGGCDGVIDWCGGSYYCCRPVKAPTCCPMGGPRYSSLSEIPRPDLSYTNLDGLVDFGTTTLRVNLPADGDFLETNLKGRVAIQGGICGNSPCAFNVLLIELTSVQNNLKTAKGKKVTGLFARNADTWKGQRLADGTILMDSANKLALEATIDGEEEAAVLNPNSWFQGSIHYNVMRLTGGGSVKNNLIEIAGNFSDENVNATLTIKVWATNCQPAIQPTVQCLPNIEQSGPGYLWFDSKFSLLGNLQSSQDLCDALAAEDYAKVCTAGGTSEFPTFGCKKQPLPPLNNQAEIAKLLKFRWRDALGTVFGNQPKVNLEYMPVFPVELTVTNKWGKTVSAVIQKAPQGSHCPRPIGLLAFGVVSGAGKKESGTENWTVYFNEKEKRYEISIHDENYYFRDYTAVITPSFSTGQRCSVECSSFDGKLLIQCYNENGDVAIPAGFSFLCYKKPVGTDVARGPTAFGVFSGTGTKESGTENWNVRYNEQSKQYEIMVQGENYYFRDYTTVVTPSFATGQVCSCETGSVDNKLLIQCYDENDNLTVPASLSFLSYSPKEIKNIAHEPLALGVVSGDGKKESGSTNWSVNFDSGRMRYEIEIAGEDYHYSQYATMVTASFNAGKHYFHESNSVGGKLLIQFFDKNGKPMIPVSFSFMTYKLR